MLANRVRKNARRLGRWARKEGTDAYRLYDLDIPEIPLSIDRYGEWLYVAETLTSKRPEGPAAERWLEAMLDALEHTLEIDRSRIVVRQRKRQRGATQYERRDSRRHRLVVNEYGLEFLVNLTDYLDTGLFLDHRLTRRRFGSEARGQRVLNLFAYTGAFTVHAAAGLAESTTTVDMSNTYLSWAEDNLKLNGLNAPQHAFIQADVLRWLGEAAKDGRRFDLAIVDPPTWSTSKRMDTTFDIQRDHLSLLSATIELMSPGATVYFSTNRRGFRFDSDGLKAGVHHEEITRDTTPPDFPRRAPHRCWRLEMPG